MIESVARLTAVGLHCWPDAPEHRAYLRHVHRHLFCFEVTVVAGHPEEHRDPLEIASRTRALLAVFYPPNAAGDHDFKDDSCELVALNLLDKLALIYPARPITVTVLEDNENGATARIP